jgi:L-alanine-DL-glutamate epimerase-like enolase superfamily enzyme
MEHDVQTAPGTNYARLAPLPLIVDDYRRERHELDVSSGFHRVTTEVVLRGAGREGRGEDVTYAAEDHDGYPDRLPLTGAWSLDEFSRHIGGLDLFPAGPPQQEMFRQYRRWAFESAALDLALRQQDVSLGDALGRRYRPLRFVVSTRLDIRPWLGVDPDLEFKLDPTPGWDAALMTRIAATGRVRALDFKAFYKGSPVDNPPTRSSTRGSRPRFPTPSSRILPWMGRRDAPSTGRRRA